MLSVQITYPRVSSIMTIAKITFTPTRMLLFNFIILLQRLKSCYVTSAVYIFHGKLHHGHCKKKTHKKTKTYSSLAEYLSFFFFLFFKFRILLQCLNSCYAGMVQDGQNDRKIMLTLQLHSDCYVWGYNTELFQYQFLCHGRWLSSL